MIENYANLGWQQDARDCNLDYERRAIRESKAKKGLWFLNIMGLGP
jgi:hypothetical protein